jgi:hypothetical protein
MLEAFESYRARGATELQEIVVCVFDTPQFTGFQRRPGGPVLTRRDPTMHEISPFLHFAEHTLQEVALGIHGPGLPHPDRLADSIQGRQGAAGRPRAFPGTTVSKGVLYSWANIAMPWAMESTRTKPLLYAQFVVFHLGVTAAIGLSFVIPYASGWLEGPGVMLLLRLIIGGAFLVGALRIVRSASGIPT